MSLKYIRDYYLVPAFKGHQIVWNGIKGTIINYSGPHLKVRLDDKKVVILHPTDVTYLKSE